MHSQSFSASYHLIMNPPNSRQVFQVNPRTKHHQSPRLPRTTTRKDIRERHSSLNKKKSVMMMNMPMEKSNFPLIQNQRNILHIQFISHHEMKKSNFPLIQNQRNILHIQFISHHFTPRCHKSLSSLPTPGKHLLRAPNK